jgi:hypothetical protein
MGEGIVAILSSATLAFLCAHILFPGPEGLNKQIADPS